MKTHTETLLFHLRLDIRRIAALALLVQDVVTCDQHWVMFIQLTILFGYLFKKILFGYLENVRLLFLLSAYPQHRQQDISLLFTHQNVLFFKIERLIALFHLLEAKQLQLRTIQAMKGGI